MGETYDGAAVAGRQSLARLQALVRGSQPQTAPTLSVQRVSARQVVVKAGLYSFTIDNVDQYVDISQLEVGCWDCLVNESKPDGLLGRTWDATVQVESSDAEVEQFRVQGDDILGCPLQHDRFCAQASKAAVAV